MKFSFFILFIFSIKVMGGSFSTGSALADLVIFGLSKLSHDSSGNQNPHSRMTKIKLESIKITFDHEVIAGCSRIKQVWGKSTYTKIQTPLDCNLNYDDLQSQVFELGGNTLFISHFLNECNFSTYTAYAYKCD